MKLNNILFIVLIVIIVICLCCSFRKKKVVEGIDPPPLDISGKWYGLDLMGGAVNITQNGNQISASYGPAFDVALQKIVEEGAGTGTIDGVNITFKWNNSDTPMTGKILLQDNGFKYDYHNFGYSFARTWPNMFKQNLSNLTGTLDQCYKACDENRLCTGFARHGYSKPSSTSQECELKTNAALYGNQNALYLNLNKPIPGMVWGYGCAAADGRTFTEPSVWCIQAKMNDEVYLGKLDGTKKDIPPTMIGIQWNNKLNTTWTRQAPAAPQFVFPLGYTENKGTCGVSEKTWDDISQKYYFKHTTDSQDMGDKTNPECAQLCDQDDECYAFQNIHTLQPSPCKLFYEKVTEFAGDKDDANLDKAIKDNTSCYVKNNEPPLPPPKIQTPQGYKVGNGCCAGPDIGYYNTDGVDNKVLGKKGQGAEVYADKYLSTYNYKTAAECASICNNDPRCGAFSINRMSQPSECTTWPGGFKAAKGIAYGQVGGCEAQKSCYTEIYPANYYPALERQKGSGKYAPPLPVKTFAPPKPPVLKPIPETPQPDPNKPQPIIPGVTKPTNPLIPGQKKSKAKLLFNFNPPLPDSGPEVPVIPQDGSDTLGNYFY